MDIRALVPKDKYDITVISELKKLSDTEIEPIIPGLLEWIQDMDWPVAGDTAEILSVHSKVTALFIPKLLRPEQTDDIWKFNIITYLLKRNRSFSENALITAEVERIAVSPTKGEQLEDVDKAAKSYLYE
ncbi:DUF5071 domain-containing protein [Ruminococcus sp.]|uniref:DUF5071 domain-containing protein n=1 Tax=Ruminococcus sp. TaxID=41978 RepID=UPI0025CDFF89|nr:DUF5071 domain-containing protein [Ruminococcus sp.]